MASPRQVTRNIHGRAKDSMLSRRIPGWLFELVAYGLVSVAALIADILILRSLVFTAGWNYLPASIVSFLSGAVIAYVLSVRFVFRRRRTTNHIVGFSIFLALGGVGLLINTIVMWLAVGLANRELMSAKLLSCVCTFCSNFILRRSLLFSTPEHEGAR